MTRGVATPDRQLDGPPRSVEDRFRRFLLWVAAGLFVGTAVELVLTEHTGDWVQRIPFGLCAVGLAAVAWALRSPGRASYRAVRVAAAGIAAGTAYGVYSHLSHNLAFELEIRPEAAWTEGLAEAFFGASPLLAPGILGLAALLAAAATFWSPVLSGPSEDASSTA